MINEYLAKLEFTSKEQILYLALAELGKQPASTLAKKCKLDRVTAYKNLKHLVERGFVKIYYERGIQYFGIQNFTAISEYLKGETKNLQQLSAKFPLIEKLLASFQKGHELLPKLEIFEGEAGIKRLFRDLLFSLKTESVHQLRMLTSNTFEERLGDVPLSEFVADFFTELEREKIALEIFEATGTLLPERIHTITPEKFDPQKLPAARGTTNIFLAGHVVYITCYKHSQIGLKIAQSEIAQMFHFLFDLMRKFT